MIYMTDRPASDGYVGRGQQTQNRDDVRRCGPANDLFYKV